MAPTWPALLAHASIPAATAASPSCSTLTTRLDFARAAFAGEVAFAEMDIEALGRAREDAMRALICLGEPVGPSEAASFHRLMAMDAFTVQELDRVRAEFHAARRLQPGYQIPESVAPGGHPLVRLYDAAADADEGALEPVATADRGWIVTDGVRGAPRPAGISTILQRFDADGAIVETVYLLAGDPLPAWAVPELPVRKAALRVPLVAATGAAVVASGTLYGLAWGANRTFWDLEEPVPDDELVAVQTRANGLTWASVGTGMVALGLGTVTVLTW
ncbi:MAG: hypothetical protein ACOZNI_07635 [Myxococcota bacterium]